MLAGVLLIGDHSTVYGSLAFGCFFLAAAWLSSRRTLAFSVSLRHCEVALHPFDLLLLSTLAALVRPLLSPYWRRWCWLDLLPTLNILQALAHCGTRCN